MDDTTILTGSLAQVGVILGAVAALGAAAQGLVDVTKGWWINMDQSGFVFVKQALAPFDTALRAALGTGQSWQETLWAHWLNGRDKNDQKAIAKSLIRLGLSPENTATISGIVKVDPVVFATVIEAINTGQDLTPDQVNLLGRFDAAIDARLDAAYERADRRYRSFARNIGAVLAVALAIFAGGFLFSDACVAATTKAKTNACTAATTASTETTAVTETAASTDTTTTPETATTAEAKADTPKCFVNDVCVPADGIPLGYLGSRYFALAILVGLIAVPLAPVSKDLVSAIGAAAKAVKAAKG